MKNNISQIFDSIMSEQPSKTITETNEKSINKKINKKINRKINKKINKKINEKSIDNENNSNEHKIQHHNFRIIITSICLLVFYILIELIIDNLPFKYYIIFIIKILLFSIMLVFMFKFYSTCIITSIDDSFLQKN